jgi:ParB-like chromosome segregation protein Spo0J
LSELNIIFVDPKDLKVNKKNERKHPKANLDALIFSLKTFGFQKPIVIDKKNNVLAGHGTLLAAQELKIKKIPCVISELSGLSAKAYAVADNRTAELSAWDTNLLSATLDELRDFSIDLESLGFPKPKGQEDKTSAEVDLDSLTSGVCPECGNEL